MKFLYVKPLNSTGKWNTRGEVLEYSSKKVHEIWGDIYPKSKRNAVNYLELNQKLLPIELTTKRIGFFSKVKGYISCVDESGQQGCIRIIGTDTLKILVLVSLLCLTIIGGGYLYTKNQVEETQNAENIIYEAPDNIENTDVNRISIPAYDNLHVDVKSQKFTTPLINVKGNQCLMAYTVILKKNQKVLFESPSKLDPGKAFYKFKTLEKLSRGKYDIVIKVRSYSLDGDKKLNSSSTKSQLVVD